MMLKQNFELMADYNQWMNNNIYEAASQFNTSELAENRGAFFGSVLGTLNHILVGDIVWLKRFSEHTSPLKSLDYIRSLESPQALNSILYTDFEKLLSARIKMDSTILAFTQELTEAVLSSSLIYSNTKGKLFTRNMGALIQHFFNHQTHHRGQATVLLNQAGIDVGVTDLLMSIPDER
ncbi:MAG: DinB family protein [Pseudomonadales bacterium]|nr:DinB family protein [Pseudomonadales bacterium]